MQFQKIGSATNHWVYTLFRYGYEIVQNQQQNPMITNFVLQNKDKIIIIEGKKYLITEISV